MDFRDKRGHVRPIFQISQKLSLPLWSFVALQGGGGGALTNERQGCTDEKGDFSVFLVCK